MQVAQRLYEEGVITYMRTDGIDMAPEAIASARSAIEKEFGADYLPPTPRIYKNKAKNAQEAHEAIRPTDMFRHPRTVSDADQQKLYGLIWRRTIACQMRSAEIERTTADIAVDGSPRDVTMRAVGSVVTFPGFLAVYGVEAKSDRDDSEDDEESRELPPLAVGDTPKLEEALIEQHFTQPPPRYTEASLIKKMEELGIGRPSTYAPTIGTLQDRNYVRLEKRALVPEDRGRIVTAFLESFFAKLVEYGFTADLEEKLDTISAGEAKWKDVLRDFWIDFTRQITEIKDLRVSEVLDVLNDVLADHIFPAKEDGSDPRRCPTCGTGTLSLKLGKFGAFIGCSNYPECKHTMQLSDAATGTEAVSDTDLGIDPDSGLRVLLKSGRFGPYVQLGDEAEPKRSSIPPGWNPTELTLDRALQLLSLPREVGPHPQTGLPITAGIGRYGPFVLHDGKYANLPDVEEVFTVGANRAVDLLAAKAAGGFRRGGGAAVAAIQTFEHADGPISVRAGRYGPYVNQGKVNATLPKTLKPEDVTLEQAVELIVAKGGPSAKRAAKKAPARKAAKKAPAKEAAKKAAPKKVAAE
jgi:DNA topoisomerase-1